MLHHKKSFPIIALVTGIYASSNMALGETFYLHAPKTFSQSDSDQTPWWDAPTGGISMATLGASFSASSSRMA